MDNTIYIMIMTYNERDNISRLIRKIKDLSLRNLTIVVIDDNSPDGTSDVVKEMMKEYDGLELLLRKENKGRARAELAGLKYCIQQGADVVLEMDADFSHDPAYIPEFLKLMDTCDVVIGSRFIRGGKMTRSGFVRNVITGCARRYINLVLGMHVCDPTSGYRCFRSEVLKRIRLDTSISDGFAFIQEILYKAYRHGFSIREIPITFVDRTRGESKFPLVSVTQGLVMMLVFRILFSRPLKPEDMEIFKSSDFKNRQADME